MGVATSYGGARIRAEAKLAWQKYNKVDEIDEGGPVAK